MAVEDVKTLSQHCECMTPFVRDMLLFACEEQAFAVESHIQQREVLARIYPTLMAKTSGWQEDLDKLNEKAATWRALATEIRNKVEVCPVE
jgi:hypothetical protein